MDDKQDLSTAVRVSVASAIGFDPLKHPTIKVIETCEDCNKIVDEFLSQCNEYNVIGVDCEWVSKGGKCSPVALLQLASHNGLCALIRLCKIKCIPRKLQELLENEDIIKVGVGPVDDGKRLSYDYGTGISSTLDLRFLATKANKSEGGLQKLSKLVLNFDLDKSWRIRCSNWEAQVLTEKQINYAAYDALVGIEIFKKLSKEIESKYGWQLEETLEFCQQFLDTQFKNKGLVAVQGSKIPSKRKLSSTQGSVPKRSFSSMSTTLYNNCILQAPDGELLCTCNIKKANWYIDRNLVEKIAEEPLTIRLKFEPKARATGETGNFYTLERINQCVVCGNQHAHSRKNVVPKEYRKHFPVVMKSHSSHDVVLLCPRCHCRSQKSDILMRRNLSKICNAPLPYEEGGMKSVENRELNKIRSAARALLWNGKKLPDARKKELNEFLLKNLDNCTEITKEILIEKTNISTAEIKENFVSHGEKVVKEYIENHGGLIELEKLWREHFLKTMQPKYLPELWSTTHNADRLEILASEGRVDEEDMKKIKKQI